MARDPTASGFHSSSKYVKMAGVKQIRTRYPMDTESPQSHEKAEHRPTFDMERLSVSEILQLNATMQAQHLKGPDDRSESTAGSLIEQFDEDMYRLPERNLGKAREVFDALARSEIVYNRSLAASCIGHLLQAEVTNGDRGTIEHVMRLWGQLLKDKVFEVWHEASATAEQAISEQQLAPKVAGWLFSEVVEYMRADDR